MGESRVDASTHNETIVSSGGNPFNPQDVAVDRATGTVLFATEAMTDSIVRVETEDGSQTVITPGGLH